jgi:hypothetical protein
MQLFLLWSVLLFGCSDNLTVFCCRTNANIHFQVDEFFTECNWDHLYIFDGDSTDSLILAAFK